MAGGIEIERVYQSSTTAGRRVLVDRLWPRGLRKESLKLDLWLRDLGPTDELRRWFGHQPDRWNEFKQRYLHELQQPQQQMLLEELTELARKNLVTLLYSARDQEHNQAVVLKELIEKRLTES
jgi:uncharacterized protein YeaO (DUF488 family)